jgi:hypothetical protein
MVLRPSTPEHEGCVSGWLVNFVSQSGETILKTSRNRTSSEPVPSILPGRDAASPCSSDSRICPVGLTVRPTASIYGGGGKKALTLLRPPGGADRELPSIPGPKNSPSFSLRATAVRISTVSPRILEGTSDTNLAFFVRSFFPFFRSTAFLLPRANTAGAPRKRFSWLHGGGVWRDGQH